MEMLNWIGTNLSCAKDKKPDCWSYHQLMSKFGGDNNHKERGFNYLLFFGLPLAYTIRGIIVLFVCRLCCRKCCGKKEEVADDKTKTE